MRGAAIAGSGTAVPDRIGREKFWEGFYRDFYSHDPRSARMSGRIFRHTGVEGRHCAVDPTQEDASLWSTAKRMARFAVEAPPLAKRAVSRCLQDGGISVGEVDQIVAVSCTGYGAPGLDAILAADLGMPRDVERLHVGHMGCYAAIPALAAASDSVIARGKVTVMVCVELTSLHVQPPTGDAQQDREQMVSHALFADAAAAVVLVPQHPDQGLHTGAPGIGSFASRTDESAASLMSWDVTDLGFRMGLDPAVPGVLAEGASDVVGELLGEDPRATPTPGRVSSWAIHPGGPEILDNVEDNLRLSEAEMSPSRGVLRDYGNCSSATVLLILQRILDQAHVQGEQNSQGEAVMLAFGPGLTAYGALLKHA